MSQSCFLYVFFSTGGSGFCLDAFRSPSGERDDGRGGENLLEVELNKRIKQYGQWPYVPSKLQINTTFQVIWDAAQSYPDYLSFPQLYVV